MLSVTREHSFAAAHRLFDYNGQCERLHGHNYGISITLSQPELDSLGMVLDFAEIKNILLTRLDEAWDHKTLLYDQDPLTQQLIDILEDGSVCALPFNPTAENMAQYLGETFFPDILKEKGFPPNLEVTKVTVHETKNNYATWTK